MPFGDLDFVQYVMSIDPAKKCNVYGKGKYLLRHAFEGDWLPHDILMREKAAFSDAVGHSMVDDLKAYAEETYTDIAFDILRRKYDFAQPFTKESLLYRELFERYYPRSGAHGVRLLDAEQGMGRLRCERPVCARARKLRRQRKVKKVWTRTPCICAPRV